MEKVRRLTEREEGEETQHESEKARAIEEGKKSVMFDSRSRAWVERESSFCSSHMRRLVTAWLCSTQRHTQPRLSTLSFIAHTQCCAHTEIQQQHQGLPISPWCIKASKPTAPSKKTVFELKKQNKTCNTLS